MVKIVLRCRKMKRLVIVEEIERVVKELVLKKFFFIQIVLCWNVFIILGINYLFFVEIVLMFRIKRKIFLFILLMQYNFDKI